MKNHHDPKDPNNLQGTPSADDIDPGEPITELATLQEPPSPQFLGRIRQSIQRRVFAADAIDFSVMAFFQTFFGYLTLAIQGLFGKASQESKRG
jgi:hypothetical protein